jgi:hypothetical protein
MRNRTLARLYSMVFGAGHKMNSAFSIVTAKGSNAPEYRRLDYARNEAQRAQWRAGNHTRYQRAKTRRRIARASRRANR